MILKRRRWRLRSRAIMLPATVIWSGPFPFVFQEETSLLREVRNVMMQLKVGMRQNYMHRIAHVRGASETTSISHWLLRPLTRFPAHGFL